jgi:hypothetical protein
MDPPTVKGLARLLAASMQNGGIYTWCTMADYPNLKAGSVRTIKNIFKKANLKINYPPDMLKMQSIIEDTSPELFAIILGVNVFGDVTSRDIDIVLRVTNLERPVRSSEVVRLDVELAEMGYDITRGLDINKVYIESNGVVQFSKGGNETINMVICTYDFHTQKYPPIFTEYAELDVYQKVHALCTFIANKLEMLTTTENYATLRSEKQTIYTSGGLERIDFAIKCMDYIENRIENCIERDCDTWKSLIVKYLQLLLFDKAVCDCTETKKLYYQKLGLLQLFKSHCENTSAYDDINFDIIEGLLTRRSFSTSEIALFHKTVHCLHAQVCNIIRQNLPRLDWHIQHIPHMHEFHDCDPLHFAWLNSPIVVSDTFCETWFRNYGDDNVTINDKFIEPNENIDCLDQHPNVKANVIDIPQKSSEWMELIKFYSCGNNTGLSDIGICGLVDTLKARSNLIMGCIGETLIAKYFDPTRCADLSASFDRCTIGLIVEHVGIEGSNGSSPDMLFVNQKEIIPAEFKTIDGRPSENRGYCRAFSLAKKQITRCANILNSCEEGVCTRGLMVFLWIYEDDGKWIYEMRGGLVCL